MSEMPTCSSCGLPHWRFAKCADAPALARKEVALHAERERLKVRPQYRVPDGYVQVAPGKFARLDAERPGLSNTSSYVQVAPGKYRKVTR